MNIAQRFTLMVKGSITSLLDSLEDPERSLNSSRSYIVAPGQGHANLERLADTVLALEPESLFQFPDECRLIWRERENGFEASVSRDECVYSSKAFGGRVRPEMIYEVTPEYFSLTETIYRDSGEIIVSTNGTLVSRREND